MSSPHEQCRGPCAKQIEWVAHRLGEYWTKRTILTNDKTVVRGDVLIDDKPTIVGAVKPAFRQWCLTNPTIDWCPRSDCVHGKIGKRSCLALKSIHFDDLIRQLFVLAWCEMMMTVLPCVYSFSMRMTCVCVLESTPANGSSKIMMGVDG